MSDFDIVVIGGGSGNKVALAAAERGMSAALIEKGPLGGTCVNRGCNPSKTLIHRADIVSQIQGAERFGIDAEIADVDFESIVRETTETWAETAERKEKKLRDTENLTLYKTETSFVDDRTLAVDDEQITGEKVVIAGGARPHVPSSIDGIDSVDYLTSRDALQLEERPEELVIVGGGYIAAELGYFYGSFGTEVTIIGHSETLIAREDIDVREQFTDLARQRYDVYTGYQATEVEQNGDRISVHAETDSDDTIDVSGDELLVATGRTPNADLLDLEETDVDTDDRGYVETNDYLETSAENVWALGDIIGEQPFKHAANHEAEYVVENALEGNRREVEYTGMSHAIFTSPQVAGLGRTEQELKGADRAYTTGTHEYSGTAMGTALKAEEGFVKVLADPETDEILGCHVLGPDASTLIHEVVVAVTSGSGTVSDIADAIYIHPALSEVVQEAFVDVRS